MTPNCCDGLPEASRCAKGVRDARDVVLNGLVGIQETIQVAAQRTKVAGFTTQLLELPLHVHQVFHV
jgi:hypothetical protein